MKKQQLSFLTASLMLMLVMVSGGVQAGTSVQTAPRPVQVHAPRGDIPLFHWLKNSLVPILFGMKDANFSSNDVLFSEFNTKESYKRILTPYSSNSSQTFNLTEFNAQLDKLLTIATSNDLPQRLLDLMANLQTEIGNNTEVTMSKFIFVQAMKEVVENSHYVLILWDPDQSLINTMDQVRSNQTPSSQPFTGDEVITSVKMDRSHDNIYGRYREKSIFKYGNGTIAHKMMRFANYLNQHPLIGAKVAQYLRVDAGTIQKYAGSVHLIDKNISLSNPMKNVNLGFTVSQMQVNNLTLVKKGNNIAVRNFDVTMVEHNALGVTIFNDTNDNGIMDLTMRTVQSDRPGLNNTVLPSGSDEALFRVDFRNAGNHTYTPTSKTASKDELSFSFAAQDVNVHLNPIYQNLDESMFNENTTLKQTITEFGFTFHFQPNATSKTANLKFDYLLGDWSNKSMLAGLSLNQMIITGITDLSGRNRVMKMEQENNTALNSDASTTKARKFKIRAGQAPLADVSLDQIPYIVGGTTEVNASGQTLPLLFAHLLFGKTTSHGDTLRTIGGSLNSRRYLYSLSYPVFGGDSIEHDPSFSIVAGEVQSTTSTLSGEQSSSNGSNTSSSAPGFEFLALLAIPALILIRKRK